MKFEERAQCVRNAFQKCSHKYIAKHLWNTYNTRMYGAYKFRRRGVIMYEGERCIIFDESGNLGKAGRYFVIACIDTSECKSLHNIMKRKLKIANEKFPDMKKDHAHEIKAVDAYPCVKHHILECIASKNLRISYIVADLQHVKPKL